MNRRRAKDRILPWLCLAMVPLTMAPEEPEKLSLGGTDYHADCISPLCGGYVIEERDGADNLTREIVYAGGPLWQVLADGTSQYFHEDPRSNVVMLTEGAGLPTATAGDVLERVTYDPYGKPIFQDAANQDKTEAGGPLLAKSDLGNTLLYMGRWYDPETGSRGTSPNNDRGGLYDFGGRYLNPDEGRFITRFAEGDPDRPIITGRYAFAENAPVNRAGPQYRETDFDFVSRAAGGPMPRTPEHILLGRDNPAHAGESPIAASRFGISIDGASVSAWGVEREMKESGEKGGTEDINIGVGELHGSGGGHEIAHDLGLLLEARKSANESATNEHGEFWFDHLVPGAAGQAYPTIELEKARISSYSPRSSSDDSGLFWFTGLSPGSARARHRGYFIIDRSIPTSGKDEGSSCWIRDHQPWSGKVSVKGKKILEN